MLRKIVLILCVAFVVVCYGYPCFILPFGEYVRTTEIGNITTESTYNFDWDGTVTKEDEFGLTTKYYYKLKGNEVLLSVDENFDDDYDISISINSLYNIDNGYFNQVGYYVAIGVGILALVLIITIPRRRQKSLFSFFEKNSLY